MPAQEPWTIRRTLDWTRGYLGSKGDEHARLSAEWLLSNVTGLSRVNLYVNYDKPLAPDELKRLHGLIERRAAGEPLQYVTGEMPFRHIVLTCAPGVLIPRPETEVLVDVVLEHLDSLPSPASAAVPDPALDPVPDPAVDPVPDPAVDPAPDPVPDPAVDPPPDPASDVATPSGPRVLELGCGTGCISLSIASERPGTSVVATDISPEAVELATRNRDALGLGDVVELVECDLAEGVDLEGDGPFDVLVSNPPYIPTQVVSTLPNEVAGFEPHLALDGGADGLDVFRRIVDLAPEALAPGGLLACELFEESLGAAADILRERGGWVDVRIIQDLTHRDRIIAATRGE